jgi:hypothetical protein
MSNANIPSKLETDLRVLREDEVDAVAGGGMIGGTLTSAVNQVLKNIGSALQTVARG